jgi:hypothetical protein
VEPNRRAHQEETTEKPCQEKKLMSFSEKNKSIDRAAGTRRGLEKNSESMRKSC